MEHKIFVSFWVFGSHRMVKAASLKAAIKSVAWDFVNEQCGKVEICSGIDEFAAADHVIMNEREVCDAMNAFVRLNSWVSGWRKNPAQRAAERSACSRDWGEACAVMRRIAARHGVPAA